MFRNTGAQGTYQPSDYITDFKRPQALQAGPVIFFAAVHGLIVRVQQLIFTTSAKTVRLGQLLKRRQ